MNQLSAEAVNSRFWKPFFLLVAMTSSVNSRDYSRVTGRSVRQDKVTHCQDQVTPRTIRAIVGHFILEGTRAGDIRLQQALTSQSNITMVNNTQRAQCAHDCFSAHMIVQQALTSQSQRHNGHNTQRAQCAHDCCPCPF